MLSSLVQTDPTIASAGTLERGSIYEAFAEVAQLNAARPAMEWQGREFSFGELLAMTHELAAQIGRCDDALTPIGVLADNSPHQVAAYLAASLFCRPYAPLSPAYPQHMLQELIDRFKVSVLVYDSLSAARAGDLRVPFRLDAERTTRGPALAGLGRFVARNSLPGSTCLMFTSGSTGRPKGVSIPYRAIRNLVHSPDYVQLGPNDRVAYVANPAFDASLFEIWGALLNGATLVHLPRRELPDPDAVAEILWARRISIIFLTTALFNLVAKRRPSAFQPVRHVLFGGERACVEAVREVYARGKPTHLVHVYGPTECTTFSTFHRIDAMPAAASDLPIGRPIKGADTAILAPDGSVIHHAGTGELYIFGEGVADGYAGDPDLTQERFVRLCPGEGRQVRAYRTGDLVSQNAQGDLVFVERLDDQVKRRGFRFSLREIDGDLLAIRDVRAAKTVRLDAPGVTCRICSFIELDDPSDAAQQRVKADLLRCAPAFRIPNQIIALDALPLNANGKIDVAQLQRMATEMGGGRGSIDHAAGEDASRADVASHIRRIFEAHCLEPHCPPDRDFFQAGGDSLGAAECLLELEELLGAPLSYSDFLAEPTLSGIEGMIKRAQRQERCELRRSGPTTALRYVVFFGDHGDLLQSGLGPNFCVVWRNPTDIGRPDVFSFASVRDLAQAYTDRLLPLLGGAPCAVVGFSYGAVLGLEVASLLDQAGYPAADLILVDPDADACCGTFYHSRSRALGAEDFVDLVTAHKLLDLMADVWSRRWRTVRSKAATLAWQTLSRAKNHIRQDGSVDLRRRALVRRCFSHYEDYTSPVDVAGRITLLLTSRALEDEETARADLALMQRTFGREIGQRVVPGCSSHATFATPAGVQGCSVAIGEVLAAASREPA